MVIYIILNNAAPDTGPFNVFSDVDGFVSAFVSNVPRSQMVTGFTANAPDATNYVRIESTGVCTNNIVRPISNIPIPITTTTTTPAPEAYYWYYGKVKIGGGIVEIPDPNLINLGTGTFVTTVDPERDLLIPFNSDVDEFLWFALPSFSTIKTQWYVDGLNSGDIGGPANRFGNLFSAPTLVNYNGFSYNLYISTLRTDSASINIKA